MVMEQNDVAFARHLGSKSANKLLPPASFMLSISAVRLAVDDGAILLAPVLREADVEPADTQSGNSKKPRR
jgi:hypothetical protein